MFALKQALMQTMARYETISTKIPAELKAKIKKHDLNVSKITRQALEQAVARAELIDALNQIETRAKTRHTPDSTHLLKEDRER